MHLPAINEAIRRQHLRARFIDPALLSDASWNMPLDLAAAREERRRVYVTSLLLASGAKYATGWRVMNLLIDAGLLQRTGARDDRRRSWVALTDAGAEAMGSYFSAVAGVMRRAA